jgi:5-methyltetrahydropteroyltriglutamate--homocysteine methyltransferase
MRILTTHVGSLVRPDDFAALLRRRMGGPVSDAEYLPALRSAVGMVVAEQVASGVDVVSDGEYGKGIGWEQYVIERLDGFGPQVQLATEGGVTFGDFARFKDFYTELWPKEGYLEGVFPCVGAITYTGHAALQRDIANLKAAMAAAGATEGFLPVVAPASAFAMSPNQYYKSDEEYMFAGAEALRAEYKAIVDAGLFVQIDDAHLPFAYDRMVPPATPAEFRKWARVRVDALNHALRGLPEDRIRYHICWGSWNGPHSSDVPLKAIVDLVLRVRAGAYAIESANARHEHEWQVWKTVTLPSHKRLIPGVVSHQTNLVEHPELVAERLLRFASVVGRDRVMAGTDCGFAQGPFVRRVHPSIQWAKLQALAEGARLASKALWKAASRKKATGKKRPSTNARQKGSARRVTSKPAGRSARARTDTRRKKNRRA